ncbi:hypothetical protein Scep_010462 [Stephania cephalantha]|uniref:UBC core domain-containing protein n=1 Tax=Stephania cephalantha TaxID=152367 RepID=A0AAP0JV32_9MAGN
MGRIAQLLGFTSPSSAFGDRVRSEVAFAKKRLNKELVDITRDPPSHCSGGPVGKDILNWKGAVMGPSDSPFEGGVFFVSIQFPAKYPYIPPIVKFETRVYHPNIDFFGNINVDILKPHKWPASLNTPNLLLSICSFLTDPNPEDPFNPIANLYRKDRKKYDEIAKEWTRKYAMR